MGVLSAFLRSLFRAKPPMEKAASPTEGELQAAASASTSRGNRYFLAGEFDFAAECYREAIHLYPAHVESYTNLGMTCVEQKRYEEAKALFIQAEYLRPNRFENIMEQSKFMLLHGEFEQGFTHFAKGIDIQVQKMVTNAQQFKKRLPYVLPDQNEDFRGKTVAVYTICGLGDTLMMLRFLPALKERYRFQKMIVMCESSLLRSVKSLSVVDEVMLSHTGFYDDPLIDYYCPTMVMPYLVDASLESISNVPYMSVAAEAKTYWTQQLADLQGFKIGLVWGGNKELVQDALRSIPLEACAPLFKMQGITWVSLQKGEPATQLKEFAWPIVDWTEELKDFQDTAALIEALDLIIGVDTSVIHLAGALGCPTWLLNRYGSEWRWMLDGEISPWYPTVRIFRQQAFNDWSGVIEKVAVELEVWIKNQLREGG